MDFVTQEQCEERRKEIDKKHDMRYEEQVKIMVETAGIRADVKNLTFTIKWWLGILSGLMVGVGMWLVTK